MNGMFRIALCDDNKDFLYIERKIIHEYFSSVGEQCTCDLYTSGVDLISVDNNLSDYDLFLLDYEMDDMNGFATANRIHDIYPQSKIAFSTVFYDFTREGYKHHAVRYLVKGEESFKDEALYCYKCGWKYDVVQAEFSDFGNSANLLSLDEYKEQFNKLISNNPNYLWKNTNESLFNFNNEQIDWMKKNNINTNINKLSSNKEISKVISSINEFWNKAQSREEYLLIRELIGKILDSM